MTIAEAIYEKLKNAPPERAQKVLDYIEYLEGADSRRLRPQLSWDDVMGLMQGSELLKGDPVEIQRRLRDEWS